MSEAQQKNSDIQLFNLDNSELITKMEDESIDVILTDPPYLYLKNQKLDRPFDEQLFFSECKRVLAKDGFIVMFGRGISFYRWNGILDSLGFVFKEEIVWDKIRMYGEEEHQFSYWIMAVISTDNKIEWYVKNTAINEVIFEGNTYESCVNFLETLINKLVETGKYKYLEF